ncbi:protein translocase subunit SecD [Cellulosimicrobium arenosum]|uniref:Protein translocase subunit SecD n=1 Tax=Cellulosimicrobium arenosum TaxID=2708133 RepID=A0A927G6L9_9MICO|nr:protein translocase subunit SecD [Cellulosimicrobium arenosum]MBD8077911.1 protein translocase subunit SecD [Cellulosimicrobium arenosum]
MATTTRRARPVRTLVTLGILIIVLFGALFAGTKLDPKTEDNPEGASLTPGLALDLEGGTQIVLKPVTTDDSEVTTETINQAIQVIRQRIDAQGVSEAEITRQGQQNIVVGIPGQPSQETIDLVSTSAQMRFRPVLTVGAPTATAAESDDESADATEESADATEESADATEESADATEESADATDESGEPTDETTTDDATEGGDNAAAAPENPSDLAQITPELQEQFDALDCTLPENRVGGDSGPTDSPFVSCSEDGLAKYILGPVEIEGTDISNASSGLRVGPNGAVTNEWVVNIEFDGQGTAAFRDVTTRLVSLPSPQNQFAMVLDGLVISAPVANDPIPDGKAEISGSFTRESAATLANQLNFGSLPLTFDVQSQEQISATLGSDQLQKGLLAGAIGLLLVVMYSLVQYRVLGLVTVASLVIAGLVTFGVIDVLSWAIGYRLSLAGVAGLIVAIGITADSFIVYFERIRDELRDGRTLDQAVDKGWERARRTILASDAVNFVAAIVLYYLAVGGVRGFAFTLGLTTLVDLVVVFLFTHPLMKLLARTKFFANGHAASGLDPRRLGVESLRYAGRGRVTTGAPSRSATATSEVDALDDSGLGTQASPGDAPTAPVRETVGASVGASGDGPRMTIAERRAAQQRAAAAEPPPDTDDIADAPAADGENEEKR